MAVKNPEKPKKRQGSTALQEQGSLLAIYYAYKKGANLNNGNGNKKSKEAQEELDAALEKVYPKMTKAWYNTFINQAKAICKYKLCKHTIGTTTTSYKFGWYDGAPEGIPKSDTTSLLPDIWNLMGKEVWDVFGGVRQKDSWNTADVFLVKNGGEAKIMKEIKGLREDYLEEMEDVLNGNGAEILVGTVNTVLTQYVNDGTLIPISLKMQTSGVSVTVKETNMHSWKGMRGKITAVDSEFIKDPFMYFSVLAKDGELSFGEGPGARDPGNSLQYFASFKVGDYQTKYLIEYRLSGDQMKGEVKDIKLTNKGEDKRASAQTGTVPVDKLRDMIKEYGGKGMDDNVPNKHTHLNNQSDIKYWSDYLSSVMNDSKLTKNLGKLNITIGNINEKYGNDTKGYITKLFEIDEMCINNPKFTSEKFGVPVQDFPKKIRLKLRQLAVLRAMINAQSNNTMNQFIMETYYLAAKQNIKYTDLNGPFLKVS